MAAGAGAGETDEDGGEGRSEDAGFRLPLHASQSNQADEGVPVVISKPSDPSSLVYRRLARAVCTAIECIRDMGLGAAARPNVSFERERNAVVVRYSPNEGEAEAGADKCRRRS